MTTTAKPPALAAEAPSVGRRCARCGCLLSSYNTDELCGACTRAALPPADDTPRVPVRVWADPEVREALAAWNFGQVSRLVRQRGSIRQEDVAQLTGLSQGFLSMLESGARRLTSIDRIVDFLDGLAVPADLVRVPRRRPVPRSAPAAPQGSAISLPAQVRRQEPDAPWTAEHAVAALAEATAALTAGGTGSGPAASRLPDLSAVAQAWATATPYGLARPHRTGADVPADLLDQLQATTDLLRGMDAEHGGGSLAQAGAAHLGVIVGLLRGARYDEATGRRLAAIAADAAGQAAWYQLDSGRPAAAAQRLMLAGLRTAHASGDARVGATLLVHLAVSAYRTDRPQVMVDAVRAGQERTRTLDAPALHAVLLGWEARGHAKLGRRRETLRALGLAAELCIRGRGDDEPHWLPRIDEGDIHAQAGSCHLDLGDHHQAVTSFDLAAETLRPALVRTRGLVLARTATARLRLGDPKGAYEAGERAVELAARIRSAFLDEQIRGLADALPGLSRRTSVNRPGA
ncbi:helix-turn-helix domain-containing protein [Streptantibioticus ferralitis]|uniref:Helix-turn-helix transcriptional regulator n=1 Tax=Streptantibioticus ferralitis TaxID=236510 RepID=A0ABT5Z7Q6_9ACTN|nr:helix-turn-helix transcriptional regulator [Streptantibioticus ferralitis]MDF2259794.1 helix-turn-helix transcriptional regulator [Streptantibioticus ferralitis]